MHAMQLADPKAADVYKRQVMLTFLALLTVTRRHGALLTILATLSGLVTVCLLYTSRCV